MQIEKHIQKELNKRIYHGQMEVNTPHGKIDILTQTTIIERKEASKYKHAIGQLLAYSTLYPNRNLLLIGFGVNLHKYRTKIIGYATPLNVEYREVEMGFKYDGILF